MAAVTQSSMAPSSDSSSGQQEQQQQQSVTQAPSSSETLIPGNYTPVRDFYLAYSLAVADREPTDAEYAGLSANTKDFLPKRSRRLSTRRWTAPTFH